MSEHKEKIAGEERGELLLPVSEESYLEGAKLAYDFDMKRGWRRMTGWLLIALAQFGVVGALLYGRFGLLLLSSLLLLYWYRLRWPLRRSALRRYLRRHLPAGRTLRLRLSDEGLCTDGACIPWRSVRRVLSSPRGLLLDLGNSTLYLPRGIFPGDETRSAFLSRLRKEIPHYERIEA